MSYFYEFSHRYNKNSWYRLYSRGKFYRDIVGAWRRWTFRLWIRFAIRHKLWLNITQDYLAEFENYPIWPR